MSELRLAGNLVTIPSYAGKYYGHLQIVSVNGSAQTEIEVQAPFDALLGKWEYAPIRDHKINTPYYGDSIRYADTKLSLGGRSADDVWSVLAKVRQEFVVKGNNIDYDTDQNSNSYVKTLLWVVGIDVKEFLAKATPVVVKDFPGVDTNVLLSNDTAISLSLTGTAGADFLRSGLRNDNLVGGNGNDTLFGGAGNDYLLGEDGNDHLYGESGSDTLFSGTGNSWYDTLNGGAGDDSLVGSGAAKEDGYGAYFYANYGRDIIQVGAHTNANYIYVENLAGTGKAQSIIYTGGSDTATSQTAATIDIRDSNSQLSSTDDAATVGAKMYGANVIIHGFKTDHLTAAFGPENDTLVFVSGHGSVGMGAGNDTISLNIPKLNDVILNGSFDNNDILYFGDIKISPGAGQTKTLNLIQHQTGATDLWDAGHGVVLARGASSDFRLVIADNDHFTSKVVNGKKLWSLHDENVHIYGAPSTINKDGSIQLPFGLKLESPNRDVLAYQHHGSDIVETDTKWWIADSSPLV